MKHDEAVNLCAPGITVSAGIYRRGEDPGPLLGAVN